MNVAGDFNIDIKYSDLGSKYLNDFCSFFI